MANECHAFTLENRVPQSPIERKPSPHAIRDNNFTTKVIPYTFSGLLISFANGVVAFSGCMLGSANARQIPPFQVWFPPFLGVVFAFSGCTGGSMLLRGRTFHLFRCGFHLFRCGFRLTRLHRRFNESQGSVLTIPSQVRSTQFWGWCQPFQTYCHHFTVVLTISRLRSRKKFASFWLS